MNSSSVHSDETSDADRRAWPDRREQPTGPGGAFPPAGHRTRCRRADERRRPHFVDRFPAAMLVFVMMLLAASMVDAALTVQLLQEGSDEINPLIDHLLTYGILSFVLGKYVLTAVGMPLLVLFSNHYLFGGRVRIGHLVPILVAMYLILIGYQIVLMCQYGLW